MDLLLALVAVFLMECLIALHTLWPNYPAVFLVFLWTGMATLRQRARRWAAALVVGLVGGEVLGYFIAVPWGLTWVCLPRNHYAVAIVMFLRLFCVLLALSAWMMARRASAASGEAARRAWLGDAGGLLVGLLLIVPFALISSHVVLGHRPYYERVAEAKAREQLGAASSDYRYFARRVDPVFRPGVSVTIRASLIAYSVTLGDVQEVAVAWQEPWSQGR